MKRREFLTGSLAAASLVGLGGVVNSAHGAERDDKAKRQYFELRVYTLKASSQQKLIDDYLRDAAIPALNRLGIRPIGVFNDIEPADPFHVYVLIPYDSLDSFGATPANLAADQDYQKAAEAYLSVPKSNPAYVRMESSLMIAFSGAPRVEVPAPPAEAKSRIFELRTYESHSEQKGQKKVEMFNSGEIETMHEVGLGPVFFGQTLIGPRQPNLIYMLSGEDQEAHKKHWAGFFGHPVWTKLKGMPAYADTVSKVSNTFLHHTDYSQI